MITVPSNTIFWVLSFFLFQYCFTICHWIIFIFSSQISKQNLHVLSCQQSRLVQLVLVQQCRILHWCWGHFPPVSPYPTTPVAYMGHAPCSLWVGEICFLFSTTKLISCLSFNSVPVLKMWPLFPSTCQPQNLPGSDRSICLLQSQCFDLAPAFMQATGSSFKSPIYLPLPLLWLSHISFDWSPGDFLIILKTFLFQETVFYRSQNTWSFKWSSHKCTANPSNHDTWCPCSPMFQKRAKQLFSSHRTKLWEAGWLCHRWIRNLNSAVKRKQEDGKLRKAINTEALCCWDCRHCK